MKLILISGGKISFTVASEQNGHNNVSLTAISIFWVNKSLNKWGFSPHIFSLLLLLLLQNTRNNYSGVTIFSKVCSMIFFLFYLLFAKYLIFFIIILLLQTRYTQKSVLIFSDWSIDSVFGPSNRINIIS